MNDRNPFGGKNKHGLYVPMSEDEQEVLDRLVSTGDFKIIIKDWGWVDNPRVRFGDKRLTFYFKMVFSAPDIPQPNYYFDIEVQTRSGISLFSKRLPTEVGGKPIMIASGVCLDLALDIAIDKIDPKLVKLIKPGAHGLTTRHGNMKLNTQKQKLLKTLQDGEKKVRDLTEKEAIAATKKAKGHS